MNKLMKKRIVMLLGTMALAGLAGLAQAETRFAVQDAAGTTDKMVISDLGHIGIGTTDPTSPITIKKTGNTTSLSLVFQNTGNPVWAKYDAPAIYLLRQNDAAVNSGLPKATDTLGTLALGSEIGTGLKRILASVAAYAETDVAYDSVAKTGSAPTYLAFGTTPANALTNSERMRITSAGNVAIGTTAASQKLTVNGGIRIVPQTLATTSYVCDAAKQGTFWFTKGATNVKDSLHVCAKDATETYAWRLLY